ncbi:MAG: Two component transcriptional regulator, winged helix family [candidate division WWE3 bacterium GW2011_GWA1_42_12]|nr:MAG: Two component transcriptional regulator, winged helix family [candidate division WWE3 bacterium GW2011_GWA1_42_12]
MYQEIRKRGVCDVVADSGQCLFMAECNKYDGLVLTDNILGQNAIELCRELRLRGVDVPIAYITPFPTSEEKVLFLNSGADIYLSSLAVEDEFHAEFMASLRRMLAAKIDSMVEFKGFCLNLRSRQLFFGEQAVYLRKKEFELLEYFAFNIGRVLTGELLLEHVWDSGLDTVSNTLVVHIRNLRIKFRKYTPEEVIESRRGRGYILLA